MAKRGGYNMGMMPGNMNNLMKQAQRNAETDGDNNKGIGR